VVWIAGLADFGHARYAGGVRIRLIEQHAVADLHVVAQGVAGLVVAHAFPAGLKVALELVDAVRLGLNFHQPVAFRHALLRTSLCPVSRSRASRRACTRPAASRSRGCTWRSCARSRATGSSARRSGCRMIARAQGPAG